MLQFSPPVVSRNTSRPPLRSKRPMASSDVVFFGSPLQRRLLGPPDTYLPDSQAQQRVYFPVPFYCCPYGLTTGRYAYEHERICPHKESREASPLPRDCHLILLAPHIRVTLFPVRVLRRLSFFLFSLPSVRHLFGHGGSSPLAVRCDAG